MDRILSCSRIALSATVFSLFAAVCSSNAAEEAVPIGVNEGEMYPDFMLPMIDGKPAKLSDYRGKKVLLFHFASW